MPSITVYIDDEGKQIKLIADPPNVDEMTFWGLIGAAMKTWILKDIAAQKPSGLVVPVPQVPNGKGFTN